MIDEKSLPVLPEPEVAAPSHGPRGAIDALLLEKPLGLELLELSNSVRIENNLPPLEWHKGLSEVARRHAASVADGLASFSHAGAWERFQQCGTRCINVAENLARSDGFIRGDLPHAAVSGWVESEGHRRNLLGPFDSCGIGWAASDNGTIFITQLLALVDEQSQRHARFREAAYSFVASTPTICTAVGLVFAGPLPALCGGLLGGAIDSRYGLKAVSLPQMLHKRATNWLLPTICGRCGRAAESGELYIEGSAVDGQLVCKECHPTPSDAEVWCFLE